MSKIQEAIQQMSVEEMQERLAEYMAADKEWAPKPVAIEVRHRDIKDIAGSNIYDVIVLKDDGTEEVLKFDDRYSKLIYIYTLMHPKGYQRRSLNNQLQGFPELRLQVLMVRQLALFLSLAVPILLSALQSQRLWQQSFLCLLPNR